MFTLSHVFSPCHDVEKGEEIAFPLLLFPWVSRKTLFLEEEATGACFAVPALSPSLHVKIALKPAAAEARCHVRAVARVSRRGRRARHACAHAPAFEGG